MRIAPVPSGDFLVIAIDFFRAERPVVLGLGDQCERKLCITCTSLTSHTKKRRTSFFSDRLGMLNLHRVSNVSTSLLIRFHSTRLHLPLLPFCAQIQNLHKYHPCTSHDVVHGVGVCFSIIRSYIGLSRARISDTEKTHESWMGLCEIVLGSELGTSKCCVEVGYLKVTILGIGLRTK